MHGGQAFGEVQRDANIDYHEAPKQPSTAQAPEEPQREPESSRAADDKKAGKLVFFSARIECSHRYLQVWIKVRATPHRICSDFQRQAF